jgi:hypothetical protein
MSFSIISVGISEDGQLFVTLKKKSTGTSTQIWVKPTSSIPGLTIADIELLAKQEAAKEHAYQHLAFSDSALIS